MADDSKEGILWLQMKHISDNVTLYPCVCCLSPENSTCNVDVNVFFDNLLQGVYEYQNCGIILYMRIFY